MTGSIVAFAPFSRRTLAAVAFPAFLVLSAACGSDDSSAPEQHDEDGEPSALAGITAAHNQVRTQVGVGPLTWSPALAATAQAWADQGVDVEAPAGLIDNNPDRSTGHPYYVGENIYGSGGSATASAAVAEWAAEAAYYNYESNTCSGVCGHYTQLVWAASTELGCGIASHPSLTYGHTIVCNYGPGGNTGGRPY
jgi:hypothetical protein